MSDTLQQRTCMLIADGAQRYSMYVAVAPLASIVRTGEVQSRLVSYLPPPSRLVILYCSLISGAKLFVVLTAVTVLPLIPASMPAISEEDVSHLYEAELFDVRTVDPVASCRCRMLCYLRKSWGI